MKFWITGFCTSILSVTVLCAQTLDTFNPNADDTVFGVTTQPDGAILLTGSFDLVGGFPRLNLARLKPDGSLDPLFNPDASVACLAVQPDGKTIVAGGFTRLAGHACTNLGRLNGDGTFDPSFNSSALGTIYCVMLQPDGRVLVAGAITNLAGQPCTRIGRVNPDGSRDTNFVANPDNRIHALALQSDGKILVGGTFANLNGSPAKSIGRLNSDGSLDVTFNSSASNSVGQIVVQSNGKILVTGGFTNLAGARSGIGRLNSDGSIDPTFNPSAANSISSVAVQADGKIVVGGSFTTLNSSTRNHLGRLNPDGTLDTTFNPGANTNVNAIALQPDGRIIVAGEFTNLAGGLRNYIGRLSNNIAAAQSLEFTASSITWMRGGSSPEIWNASFEYSTNGVDWTYLADGLRVSGGWQASGLAIPANALIRARGFMSLIHSSSLLEQFAGIPFVTAQPPDVESLPKTNVTLAANVDGTPTLSYQWQFNGTNIVNGPNVTGATNASLVLSNVSPSNTGVYALIVTNSYGSVTTRLASLKIVSPATNDNLPQLYGSVSFTTIYSTTIQPDGKVILGGTIYNGGLFSLFGVERMNFDGSLDSSIRESGAGVYATAVQSNADILVGGSFRNLNGLAFTNIARLHPDGTLDTTFTNMPNGGVNAIVVQPDGKILVAGAFTILGNEPHDNIGRLNANGTLDTDFNAATDSTINSVALQPNGQIIIGGNFTNVNGQLSKGLARLDSDGTLDSTFAAVSNSAVSCVAVRPDGKILVSGPFFFLNGVYWNNFLAQLNPDGSLDTTFNATPTSLINTIVLQSDRKALIGGSFSSINGTAAASSARIQADGTTDLTFAGGLGGTVYSMAIQFDGSVLISPPGVNRFKNTEPVSQQVAYDGSTVTWVRNGPGPECSWVMFESSPDGTNWSPLGMGTYTNNAWRLTGVNLPPSTLFRIRGYVVGGYHNGSGWMLVSRSGLPFFLMNPTGTTNNDHSSVTLSGLVTGTLPIAYQWMRDGIVVTNGNWVTGAQTPSLNMPHGIFPDLLGNYTLVASNAFGYATSSVATATTSALWISSPSASIITNAGATVSFSITVIGQSPLYYQWFNGTQPLTNSGKISGAMSSTLTLSNVTNEDSGDYLVVVTNSLGGVSSFAVTLTVIDLSSTPTIVNGSINLDLLTNGFGFDLTAQLGQTIVVETSTNLIDWLPVFTNTVDSSPLHFHDTGALTNRTGFYRLRLQ